jgi:hypothetical protein
VSFDTSSALLAYYLGVGFAILLGWAAGHPDRRLDERSADRYLRWSRVAAVAGVAHPALALAARDIVGQVGHDLPDDPDLRRRQRRTATAADVLLAASVALALLVLVLAAL